MRGRRPAGRDARGSNGRRAPCHDQRGASPCAPVCRSVCVVGGGVESSLRHARRRAVPAARASNGVGFRFGVRVRVPVLCRSRRASVDGDGWLPDFHSRARLRAIAGLRIHDRFLLRGVVQATRAQSLCERRIGAQAGGRGAARAHGRPRAHRSQHRTGPYRRRVPKVPRPRQVKHVRIPIRHVR